LKVTDRHFRRLIAKVVALFGEPATAGAERGHGVRRRLRFAREAEEGGVDNQIFVDEGGAADD